MARQQLGQHFLADPGWREEIARAIHVSRQSMVPPSRDAQPHCWIEIGAGHGEMTERLAATGLPVHAIELDVAFLPRLRHLAQQYPNLSVTAGDVLRTDLAELASGLRIRLYGSLPYYITSPILHHMFGFAEIIDEAHIVVQSEVADRLAAEPGGKAYGYLSVTTHLYARPELVFQIPRGAFDPPPDVDSALITLRFPGERRRFSDLSEARFLDFVKVCFAQKRKTLANNLRSLGAPESTRLALESLGLRPDARAEQLPVASLIELQRILTS